MTNKKISISAEEFEKLKEPPKNISLSSKEFDSLPEEKASLAQDAIDIATLTGEAFDRYTGAPTRSAMSSFMNTEGVADGISAAGKAFAEQFGEPTSQAPTGMDVAEDIKREYPFLMPAEREPMDPNMPNMKPEEVVALAVDFLADPTVAAKVPMKAIQGLYRTVPSLHAKLLTKGGPKVLRTYLDDVSQGKVQNLLTGPAGTKEFYDRTVGAVLVQNDLAKYAGNPVELLDEIAGKPRDILTKTSKGTIVDTVREGGLLRKKMRESSEILRDLSRSKATGESGELIKGSAQATGESLEKDTLKVITERGLEPGQPTLTVEDQQYVRDVLAPYLNEYKVGDPDQIDMLSDMGVKTTMSLEDMNELKRGIGKRLRDNVFNKNPSEETIKQDGILKDLYYVLKTQIEEGALSLDPVKGMDFIKLNNDYTAMKTIQTALESQRGKEFLSRKGTTMDTLLAFLGGSAGAVGFSVAGYNPVLGFTIGSGAGGLARTGLEGVKNTIRDFGARNVGRMQTGNLLQSPGELGTFGAYKGLQGMGAASQEDFEGRQPQSMMSPDINPIVEDKLIPRDSEWVMGHPNLVRAKLLKAAPELAAQVSIALERNDLKTLKKVMPQIAHMVPEVFEQDDFNVFDGKIIDPNDKARYSEMLMSDPNLNSIERAEMIDHLNRTNEVLK